MIIRVRKGNLVDSSADLLVLNSFQGMAFGGATADVNTASKGLLAKVMKDDHFSGKLGEMLLLHTEGLLPAKRVLVVGLGKQEDFNEESVRHVAAVSLQKAKALHAKKVVSILHGAGNGGISPERCAHVMTEGVLLGDYEFLKHKSKKANPSPDVFDIVTLDAKAINPATESVRVGTVYAQAAILARDLVNEPGEHMHPENMVNIAKEIVKTSKGLLKIKVYNKTQLTEMGAGGILAVGRGSQHSPFLVHLTYKPAKAKKRMVFVGKAITFDSGGLSIKPSESMETMKCDMAGAAAVLGCFSALPLLKPNVEIHGIFAACENMPSGNAYRPGDILKMMNGKTMEILNTDAEGRLTLADALTYASTLKPDLMVDLATLTGACMVALGEEIAGLMTNRQEVADAVLAAAHQAGENMWQLPLEKSYRKCIDSKVADISQVSSTRRYGGAITAGLILQEFVNDLPWAHLDIAGPAFASRSFGPYSSSGATGFGARTLLEIVRQA